MLNCHRHHEREATSTLYGIPKCRECVAESIAFHASQRAFGTGCGPEAHAEAQYAASAQREYDSLKPQRYEIIRGGKPV